MPRTRHDLGRDAKIDQILAIAERQLREGGFAGLSVAAVARELGVANNAVYWYFPSRDHLFVAVGRRYIETFPSRKPPRAQTVSDRAVWIVGQIAELQPLLTTMRERARVSEVVAEFEREVEGLLRQMIVNLLSFSNVDEDLDVAVDAFWAAIEGVLSRQLPRRRRDAVVRFAVERFIGSEAAAAPHP